MVRVVLLILSALIVLPLTLLHAQDIPHRINVIGVGGLNLGRLILLQSGELVAFNPADDARFTVQGEPGRAVRLIVAAPAPNQYESGLGITIASNDCQFSLDEGRTWQKFISGILSQDTRFSNDGMGNLSTIHVRIGGTPYHIGNRSAGRGEFVGSLRLTALYLEEGRESTE